LSLGTITLKPGKEKPLLQKHHWIFSGAVASIKGAENGALFQVVSAKGDPLGVAYANKKSSILARMISFETGDPLQAIDSHLHSAISLRKHLIPSNTTAYRVVNGEGDLLPGLIVDKYGDYLIIQISTLGMERLKPLILDKLQGLLKPKGILEKSELPSRKEEGLQPVTTILSGTIPEQIEILENGLKFLVEPQKGQKTGFFLDQREMRSHVREIAKGKRVLNCFSYTGGFSVYAAAGGAASVDSADISKDATELAKRNMAINGFNLPDAQFHAEDVFEFLRAPLPYDLVILDPPAFAKRAKDVVNGCRGYKEINRLAMQKMPKDSILITCSCSYHVDEELFQKVVFQAALEAGRNAKLIGRHRQAADHPVNLYHPEGDYLKSLILWLE
jgi:23S rRNA (cytosine1962-C5)-methyltransferase